MSEADTQAPVGEQDTQAPEATQATEKPWIESFSPEFRENPAITKYKSPDELAKGFLEAQKLVGKEKIPLPGENAKPEDWAMVYDRLGRPTKPEEYKLSDVKLPEGLQVEETYVQGFKAKAHELGFNNQQIDGLWKFYTDVQTQAYQKMVEDNQKANTEAEQSLRKEWGTAYQEKVALATKVLKLTAGDDFEVLKGKLGSDPLAIKFLANLGSKISEDSLGDAPKAYGMTPDEAKAEISKIQGEMISNPKHPLNDQFHPENKLMKEKLDNLYRQANPELK